MIEFFSGIGGMRYGVEQAIKGVNLKHSTTQSGSLDGNQPIHAPSCFLASCVAYEISLYANRTYENCRKDESKNTSFAVHTKLVEQLKAHDLDGKADLWTM